MDPAVRQSQRVQAGIEATQDAVNPGWLLQLNSNVTGSVNMHDGYAHYTSEAAADNGLVLTQDRRIYNSLVNSGLYSLSSTRNVGTYMKAALGLDPMAYWRAGESGNSRVAVDLVGGNAQNLVSNPSFEGNTLAPWATTSSGTGQSTASLDTTWSSSADTSALVNLTLPVNPSYQDAGFKLGFGGGAHPAGSVPVTVGSFYTIAMELNVTAYQMATGGSGLQVDYKFLDSTGALVGSESWTAVATTTGRRRAVVTTVAAPANAAVLVFGLHTSINGSTSLSFITVGVDSVMVTATATAVPYADVYSPSGNPSNLCTCPNFETDRAGWFTSTGTDTSASSNEGFRINGGSTATISTAQHQSGSQSLQVTTTASPNFQGVDYPFSVVGGRSYSVSLYVRGNVGGEAVGAIIGDGTVGSVSAGASLTNSGWTRITITNWVPSVSGTTGLSVRGTGSAAITFFLDSVQIVQSSTPPASFYEGNGGYDADYIGSFTSNLLPITNTLDTNNAGSWYSSGAFVFSGGRINGMVATPTPFIGPDAMSVSTTGILDPPVLNAPTVGGTAGVWGATGTYFYKITFTNANGETVGSNEVSAVVSATTQTVTLTWPQSSGNGATGVKIYRATAAGGESTSPALVSTLTGGPPATTYTDTGTAAGAGNVPASNTATSSLQGIALQTPSLTSGQPYTFSVYVRGNAGGEVLQVSLAGGSITTSATSVSPALSAAGWTRVWVTATPSSTGVAFVMIRTNVANSVYTFFANAAQLTATPSPVPYSDTTGIRLGQAGVLSGGGDTDTQVQLDGQVSNIKTPLVLPGNFSLSAWATPAALGGGSGSNSDVILFVGGGWLVGLQNQQWNVWPPGVGQITSAVVLSINTVYHVVVTFDGTNARLYINGAIQATSAALAVGATTSATLNIGGGYSAGLNWNGKIDEPAVFGYALSASQVSTLYASR